MSSKCQSCGVVGLTEHDVHLAEEILGEGWETMCLECARGIQRHNETHHQCNYCEEEIEGENVVPRDETEWNVESKKHRKDCEWVLTRAHTKPNPNSVMGKIIFHGLDDCWSFKTIKQECREWCEKNGVHFSLTTFQELYDDILSEEVR